MENSVKPTSETEVRQAKFLVSLKENNFNITRALLALNYTRDDYKNWVKRYPDFKEKMQDVKDGEIDEAEEQLRIFRKGIPKRDENGNIIGWLIEPHLGATIYFLKTMGRSRGWNELDPPMIAGDDVTLKLELVEDNPNISKELPEHHEPDPEQGGDEEQ